MARSFNANTDKLYSATTSAFPTNGTVFIRAKTTWAYNDGASHFFWAQESADVNVLHFQKNANDSFYIGHVGAGDTRLTLVGTGLFTSGVWRNYLYEYESTFQAFYVDNVLVISNTSNVNSTPAVGLTIGNTGPLNGGSFGFANFAGSLAEFAQWNRRLTTDEKYLLQVTGNPANIPSGRVKYYPIQGSVEPEPDTDSLEYLTVTSAPQDTHPATSLLTTTSRAVAGVRTPASLVVTNLCTNGGFESNITGWTKSAGLETFDRVTTDSVFGSGSARLAESSSAGSAEYAETTSKITGILTGEWYTASCYAKRTVGSGNALNGNLIIWWYTAADAFISADTVAFGTAADGVWTRFSKTAKAPPAAAKAVVVMSLDGCGAGTNITLLFDGVQFEKGQIATPYIETNGSSASNDIGRYAAV